MAALSVEYLEGTGTYALRADGLALTDAQRITLDVADVTRLLTIVRLETLRHLAELESRRVEERTVLDFDRSGNVTGSHVEVSDPVPQTRVIVGAAR